MATATATNTDLVSDPTSVRYRLTGPVTELTGQTSHTEGLAGQFVRTCFVFRSARVRQCATAARQTTFQSPDVHPAPSPIQQVVPAVREKLFPLGFAEAAPDTIGLSYR